MYVYLNTIYYYTIIVSIVKFVKLNLIIKLNDYFKFVHNIMFYKNSYLLYLKEVITYRFILSKYFFHPIRVHISLFSHLFFL